MMRTHGFVSVCQQTIANSVSESVLNLDYCLRNAQDIGIGFGNSQVQGQPRDMDWTQQVRNQPLVFHQTLT